MASVFISSVYSSFIFYFIFAFIFEISFLRYKTNIRLLCSKESIGHVSAFIFSMAQGGMISTILVFGFISDYFGFVYSSVLIMLIALMVHIVINLTQNNSFSRGVK